MDQDFMITAKHYQVWWLRSWRTGGLKKKAGGRKIVAKEERTIERQAKPA